MSANTYRADADSSTVSPLDRRFPFTIIPDLSGATMHVEELSLRELAARAKGTRRKTKKRLPLFNGAAFGDVLSDKGSLRHDANVMAVAAVVVDYDGGTIAIGAARAAINAAGLNALVLTSPTNGEPGRGYRWRGVFPLSRPHDRAAYEALAEQANGLFGGALDKGSREPSRSYFIGHTGKLTTYLVEGRRWIDEADDLPRTAWTKAETDAPGAHDHAEKWGRPLHVLRSALFAVPNDGSRPEHADRDWWLKIVAAVNFETSGADEGFAVLDDWSRQWPGYDAEKTRAAWDSFRRSTGRVVTGRHILNLAEAEGWRDLERMFGLFDDLAEEEREDAAWQEAVDDIVGKAGGGFFESVADWGETAPEREWLIKDLIPNRQVTLLYGDGATGKSLLALQLAAAVANGSPWIGRAIDRPGVALFFTAEDDRDEVHRRVVDIATHHGTTVADLCRRLYAHSTIREDGEFEDPLLASLDPKKGLVPTAAYERLDREMGRRKPSVVVLDTLAHFHDGDENAKALATRFIGLMRRLAVRHKCVVRACAPQRGGHGQRYRLSGQRGLEQHRAVTPLPDEGEEWRRHRGEPGRPHAGDHEGQLWSVRRTDRPALACRCVRGLRNLQRQRDGRREGEGVFLKLLDLWSAQPGRYVSPSPSNTYAPKVFAAHPEAEGCTKGALEAAMHALFKDGTITTGLHGRAGSERSHLVRANRG
ncbi:AAA family ATPase [Chenggangzhangella methanolivorans]|uniref:AAA family ATPase n=1 Tax=Chenggangzhangella methanolivorans TaxID=1437009 RepID=A0A9E6R7D7_9HYPH|nr:AAA family ATPase [Chenggangzhangella methanolivorans]QZN98634.1 AAA family ATPase [Chenggangzhangella methanolivorans]